ncbi:MAG: S49 family peptidase, partial [Arenibacter algicola]|nr:S49 family peptidase [Arenibacter algicola]
ENKARLNAGEPLSEKAETTAQERINSHYQMFVATVATNRGVSPETVLKNFGQGKTFLADQAIKIGMADEIGSLDETIARYRRPSNGGTTGSRLGNSILRGETVNPKLLAFLKTMGAVSADSDNAEQLVALRTMCAALGVSMTDDWKDKQESILVDLQSAQLARVGNSVPAAAAAAAAGSDAGQGVPAGTPGDDVTLSQRQREQASREERSRIQDLQARGALLNISQEQIDAAVNNGTPVETALLSWTENLSQNEQSVTGGHSGGGDGVEFVNSSLDKFDAAAVEALAHMMDIGGDEPLSAAAKPLQNKSLVFFASESLRLQGIRTEGMIPEQIASMAMRMDEDIWIQNGESSYNRPGTFPALMSSLAGKMLLGADEYSPATYTKWAYKMNDVPDFKPKTVHQVGEFGEFPELRDGADFDESTTSEEVAWIQVGQYGDEFKFTPVMLANDDLGALKDALSDKQIANDMP